MFKNNGYFCTKNRNVITDINEIPFPSYEGLGVNSVFQKLKEYNDSWHFDYEYADNPRVLPMIFGRSCPYNCKFCFHTMGRQYRTRSLDNFFAELDYLVEQYDLTGITVMDEFFGVQEKAILEFCQRIRPYKLKWFAELRVDVITASLLKAMKESGCTNILLGLESMSHEILLDMRKRISPDQIENALSLAYKAGIRVAGNFIFGTEHETMETFYETFDWWNNHRNYQIYLITLNLYPGSEYYKNAVQKKLIEDEEKYIAAGMPEVNCSKLTAFEWDKVKRIIRLSNIDGVMDGRILEQKESDDIWSFKLKCRHCSNEFFAKIRVRKEKRLDSFWYVCPACEQKTRYNLKNDIEPRFEKEIYYQLAMNNSNGLYINEWLLKNNYYKVILWGFGDNDIIPLMIKEIESTNIQLVGISGDKENKMNILAKDWSVNDVIYTIDLIDYECDVVIICETTRYPDAVRHIRNKGYSGRLDSFVNVVLQHDYFLEKNVC